MSNSKPPVIDTTVQKSISMISDVKNEAHFDDNQVSFQAMRAVLRTLRDRLPPGEAAQLGAQLPQLISGFYYEGWQPTSEPENYREQEVFLDRIRSYMNDTKSGVIDADRIARSVFQVLESSISEGEIEDIKQSLPQSLRKLWP